MARCDQDDTCYRVFCVTLLAIALTFTLILTDVFMDIDGLIRANEKEKQQKTTKVLPEFERINDLNIQLPPNEHDYPIVNGNSKPEPMYDDIKNLENNEEVEDTPYRTKRSLESYQSQLDNPNVQNIITKNLAALFEPLSDRDRDGSKSNNINQNSNENSNSNDDYGTSQEKNNIEIKIETNKVEDDLLHLIMHNILLEGLLGHMDLNEVYKKINTVVDNYDAVDGRKEIESVYLKESKGENKRTFIQNKFYDELMHCKQLQTEIAEHTKQRIEKKNTAKKEPKMFIKTVIDIQPLPKEAASEKKTQANDFASVVKLMYSSDSDKRNEVNEKDDTASEEEQNEKPVAIDNQNNEIPKSGRTDDSYRNSFITDAIAAYLAKHPNLLSAATSKRLKRNVKVRKHPTTTHKPKVKVRKPSKVGDDELYVEIETHFDSKNLKGDKKRKLVKNIIEKIQKAIHNNLESIHVHDKKAKQFKVRRRVQNPLESIRENVLINKFIVPIDNFMRRDSAPLSKTNTAGNSPYVDDSVGDNWRKAYMGPHFLSGSKAINSAELGEINVNYDKVPNAIPQRLQVPLNADETEDNFYELGNMKFYIKELDGTGFSIGFNQYLGEPPDEDSMKSFTGIDNLIKTYQSKYEDDVNNPNEKNENNIDENKMHNEKNNDIDELKKLQRIAELPDSNEGHELKKREVKRIKDGNFHKIYRRSTENNDYHSNEYKIIFNNNFLPYHSYQDIFTDKRKKYKKKVKWPFLREFNISNEDLTTIDVQDLPFLIDNNIINKNLRPSEILGLANLLGRKKRSIKKFSKINMSKLRYINTNMNPKRIFLKTTKPIKRMKRQIDNIRIVTADGIHNMPLHRHSEENVLVVSNEDIFPNARYSPNEMELPENFEQPEKPEESYSYGNIANSMIIEPPRQPTYSNIFEGMSRHNALMSKYPHIFMEEISRSKEEEVVPNNNAYNMFNEFNPENQQQRNGMESPDDFTFSVTSTENPEFMYDIPTIPKVKEIVDAIVPKSNYKLTVKILPRNMSFNGFPSGFKEIHTSINKSISKNGLLISSLLNVSEISKVEKLNNQTDEYESATVSPLVRLIKNQQDKMKTLLRQHKKKIDEQLDHLNKEKMNLESIIVDKHDRRPVNTANNGADHIDVMLPSNPPQLLHITKDEAGQLISSALMKLKDIPQKENKVTSVPPKNRPLQKATTTPKPVDQEKMRIINTIQHNDNLTNKILNKIDRNTEILQRFLQKFAERLDSPNIKRTDDYNINRNEKNPNNINNQQNNGFNNNVNGFPNNVKIPMPYQTHWKDRIRDPFFKQTMPNLEVMKNDTHVSIPFVYAYQQPYPLANNNKPNTPVASVVYQGHIHTNALRGPYIDPKLQYEQKIPIPYQEQKIPYQPPKYQEKLPKLPIGNQTKFFIDGDVNDFKLAKDEYGAGLGANITHIS